MVEWKEWLFEVRRLGWQTVKVASIIILSSNQGPRAMVALPNVRNQLQVRYLARYEERDPRHLAPELSDSTRMDVHARWSCNMPSPDVPVP